jgi:hypothetical protein
MRSTRKYGRRNRRRRTKKNRLYGGADKEDVPNGKKLQHLFDTSPSKNSLSKKNPNKFTVEVRDLSENYVQMLLNDVDEKPQKYIIKITDASNNSVYCTSTQDFKETINKNFNQINEGKLYKLNLRRNKTIIKRIKDGVGEGLGRASSAVSSGVGAVSSRVGKASSAVSSGVSAGVGKVISAIRVRSNPKPAAT